MEIYIIIIVAFDFFLNLIYSTTYTNMPEAIHIHLNTIVEDKIDNKASGLFPLWSATCII